MNQAADRYLDADELMHLALTAAREGRNEEAIVYFKRGLEVAPNEASLHYLLGAQYLRIGLNQRAVGHIEHGLALNPGLDGARFQLGWIYWSHGNIEAATETWKAFDNHGAEHPLFLFKSGLLHLANNEYDECEDFLRRGIAANQVDAALNHDMAEILKRLQGRAPTSTAKAASTVAPKKPEQPSKSDTIAKGPMPPKAASQEAAKAEPPSKTDASGKLQAGSPKPKTPNNVVLSAYQKNKSDDAANQ